MSFFNFGKPKRVVTLDIGSHSIKLAEFLLQKKKVVLENFAFLPMPEECVVHEELTGMEVLHESFSRFVKQNTEEPFSLYAAIGGRTVIIKKVEIPRVEAEIINDLVAMEVNQNLPFNIEDINYHYEILSQLPPKQEDRMNILLVVAKKNIVVECDRLIKAAGYTCKSVDVEEFALASCVQRAYPGIMQSKKNVLVLNIGKRGTVFMVLASGTLIFKYYIAVGGDTYNDHLIRNMDISHEEAEELKISCSTSKEAPEEVKKILKDGNLHLAEEIMVGSEYFNNHFADMELSLCYITGGGSHLPDLKPILEKQLKIPVERLNPLPALECNPQMEAQLEHIQSFAAVSVGLCFRSQEE